MKPRPLGAAFLLLCALLFLRTSAHASRSDGHFPLADIPAGRATAINGSVTVGTSFTGEVNGKTYAGGLNEGVTWNPDGSLAGFAVAGGGGSIGATVAQSPLQETTNYHDGNVFDTHFYHAGPRKSVSGPGDGRSFTYQRLKLRTETHTGGTWAGSSVDFVQDDRGRLEKVVVHRNGGVTRTFDLGYDAYARLESSSTAGSTATYTRNADGQLATLTRGPVATSWSYVAGKGLLAGVTNANAGGNSFDFHFTQDAQRRHQSRIATAGVSWANLHYDANDQLTSGSLSIGSPVAYGYDARGNRVTVAEAGQTANILDQVTWRTLTSRGFGVLGSVDPLAKVRAFTSFTPWWAALPVDPETGGFFHWWDVPLTDNDGAAVPVETRVQGVLPVAGAPAPAVAEAVMNLVVPPAVENLIYDGAGRLIDDAFWHYTWDHAGRLMAMQRKAGTFAIPGTQSETLAFGYDADGRRTSRTHTRVDASGNPHVAYSQLLWAGWLPVLEERWRDGTELPRRWFQWGADVSGTLEGAAGIGGLVAILEEGGRTLLPVQDGLGNISAVIDAASGQTVARYQFGPFGEPLGESGDADACPFRWQTRWWDPVCEQYSFIYRPYSPRLGRWLSRDPIGEAGGFNLYAYCGNDPVNRHDPLGLAERNGQLCQSDLYASWIDSDLKNGHYFKAVGDFFGAVFHGIKGASAQTGTEMVEARQQIDAQINNGEINPVFGGTVRGLQYCADLGQGVGLAPFQPGETAKGVVKAPVLVPFNFGQSLGEFTIAPTLSKFFDIGENGANVALLLEGARSSGKPNVTAAKGGGTLADVAPGHYTFADSFDLSLKHDFLIRELRRGDVLMHRGTASAELMGELTRATGREVALIRRTDGARVLRLGVEDEVRGLGAARIIAHTHPSNILRLSRGDILSFWHQLPSQRSTVIVGGNGAGILQHIPRNPWPSF
jgi:RHS repeat-associated protein